MTSDPSWLKVARKNFGVAEVPGPKHSGVISAWLKKLSAWWTDDETPWCGTFVAHCLQEAGLPVIKNWYRAKAWAEYGSRLQTTKLAPGAILVFSRAGGGHVGFYVGEDDMCYHVLGGNQGNKVCVTRILKIRCIATRWPKDEPVTGSPILLKMNGTPISSDEA